MEQIRDFEFFPVRSQEGYVEFSTSYRLEYNLWSFEGVGWVTSDVPHYDLRRLFLNKWPAGSHYNKKVGISHHEGIMKFESPFLDHLVISSLERHFNGYLAKS